MGSNLSKEVYLKCCNILPESIDYPSYSMAIEPIQNLRFTDGTWLHFFIKKILPNNYKNWITSCGLYPIYNVRGAKIYIRKILTIETRCRHNAISTEVGHILFYAHNEAVFKFLIFFFDWDFEIKNIYLTLHHRKDKGGCNIKQIFKIDCSIV